MNREDIIRMAREAGLEDWAVYGRIESKQEILERFANLVASAEREACAKACEAQRDAKVECHPARIEFSDNFMALRCAAIIRARRHYQHGAGDLSNGLRRGIAFCLV